MNVPLFGVQYLAVLVGLVSYLIPAEGDLGLQNTTVPACQIPNSTFGPDACAFVMVNYSFPAVRAVVVARWPWLPVCSVLVPSASSCRRIAGGVWDARGRARCQCSNSLTCQSLATTRSPSRSVPWYAPITRVAGHRDPERKCHQQLLCRELAHALRGL